MKKTQPQSPQMRLAKDNVGYRLAICGGKGSGKTCILAALAMPRIPHPEGFMASMPHLPGDASDELKHGYEWVRKCLKSIEDGEVPEQNAIKTLHTPRLRYQFTTKGGRESFVDIFDYSGELMEGDHAVADLAAKLRVAQSAMDGLLVVAEHPRLEESDRDRPDDAITHRLHDLGSAFALLRHEARSRHRSGSGGKPIAVLVNKWDRAGTLTPPVDAQLQTEVLGKFIESSPPHANLCAQLQPGANHMRVFAVSALGPGREGTATYKPAQVKPHLLSFGLEDPFIWIMEAIDAVDIAKLEERVRSRGQWWNPFAIWKTWCGGHALSKRIMPRTDEGRKLFWLRARATFAAVRWCFMLSILGMVSFAGYEKNKQINDDTQWASIEKESDLAKKDAGLKKYLRDWPAGRHKFKAERTIDDIKIDLQRDDLQRWLDARNTDIKVLAEKERNTGTEDSLKELQDNVTSLANKVPPDKTLDVALENQRRQYADADQSLRDLKAKIEGRIHLGEVHAQYFALMRYLQMKDAADMLLKLDRATNKELFDDFRANIMASLGQKHRKLDTDGSHWKEAEEQTVNVFTQAVYSELMPEGCMESLDEIRLAIRRSGDQFLYERCRDKNPDNLRGYVDSAPVGSMKADVEKYIKFLEARDKHTTMTLSLSSVEWQNADANWLGRVDTVLKIFVLDKAGNDLVSDEKVVRNVKRNGRWTDGTQLPSVTLSSQAPSARIQVSVQLFAAGYAYQWATIGKWSDTVTMEDLHKKERSAPDAGEGFGGPTEISFEVSGLPGEPDLPEHWHDLK